MRWFTDTFQTLKPIVFTLWIVAVARLVAEALTENLNVIGMISVYGAVAAIFLFAGFTGQLDFLTGRRLFAGAFVLAVSCWFLPNSIAYTTAQFAGWTHGRFFYDHEYHDLVATLGEDGMDEKAAAKEAVERLGHGDRTRTAPPADTATGKVKAGVFVGLLTTLAGMLWCLLTGALFLGVPARFRRRMSVRRG